MSICITHFWNAVTDRTGLVRTDECNRPQMNIVSSGMILKINILLVHVLVTYLLFSSLLYAQPSELRGVFVRLEQEFGSDPIAGRIRLTDLVERLAAANINYLLPWVRSEYIASVTDSSYTVPCAKWDALKELTEAAAARNIKVHLWYSATYYKQPKSPDFNPEHRGSPMWAAVAKSELPSVDLEANEVRPRMDTVCLVHPEARAWELELITNTLSRYPLISGVHIEEPGYGGRHQCLCPKCQLLFKQIYGLDAEIYLDRPQSEDLRCLGTTEFMRSLKSRLLRVGKHFPLSVNGSYSWRSDRKSGRDWHRWAVLGLIDFYVAQIYEPRLILFESNACEVTTALSDHCPVMVALSTKKCSVATILQQIQISRRLGAKGVVLFHSRTIPYSLLEELRKGPFREPASLPFSIFGTGSSN